MRALVLDDEKNILDILEILFNEFDIKMDKANSVKDAKELMKKNIYDIAFIDLRLPDGSGLEILKELKNKYPKTEIVMITAYASPETAVEALKLGAFDYISKPFDINKIRLLIRNLKDKIDLEKKLSNEKEEVFNEFIGETPQIRQIKEIIKKIAPYDINVLILGESGTGKEVVAKTIHKLSKRKDKPFIAFNCAALPPDLLESELFGYKKGAFTGANTDKKGLIEEANGGTLFLDEIGEMPIQLQAKLLRFLEDGVIRPLGSTREIKVDVRVISATNRDLEREIKEGNFREDLYYRLATITIKLPPLRERKEDIPLLVKHILSDLEKKYNKKIEKISTDFMNYLYSLEYKGNIRELRNLLEKAVIFAENGEIKLNNAFVNIPLNSIYIDDPYRDFTIKKFPDRMDLKFVLNSIEKAFIKEAMKKAKGKKVKASEILGLTFREFRYRYDKYFKDEEKENLN
ncbi:MAG: sigma-54-dependent Fis family transcriptional regulator [Persephonella sp.]|nr:MAG: sigma-54-dependent Fis family transcriptional regulator [Persephonella sp.]